jgi:hypothetical protein
MEEDDFDAQLGVPGPARSRQERGQLPDRGRAVGARRFDDVFDRRAKKKDGVRSGKEADDWGRLDRW